MTSETEKLEQIKSKMRAASTTLAGISFVRTTTIADVSTFTDLFDMLDDLGVFDSIDWQKLADDYVRQHPS